MKKPGARCCRGGSRTARAEDGRCTRDKPTIKSATYRQLEALYILRKIESGEQVKFRPNMSV